MPLWQSLPLPTIFPTMLFLTQYLGVILTSGLLTVNLFVLQQGDTLKFLKGTEVIDQWMLFENDQDHTTDHVVHTRRAKVSADSSHFFIHEEERHKKTDSISTKITLYNAAQKKLWEKSPANGRIISYPLTNIYHDLVIMVTTNRGHTNPSLDIINSKTI